MMAFGILPSCNWVLKEFVTSTHLASHLSVLPAASVPSLTSLSVVSRGSGCCGGSRSAPGFRGNPPRASRSPGYRPPKATCDGDGRGGPPQQDDLHLQVAEGGRWQHDSCSRFCRSSRLDISAHTGPEKYRIRISIS